MPPFQSVLEGQPEHVKAIGMISVEVANLELFMGQMLGALIGIDSRLAEIIYLTPKTAIGRIEILENVASQVLVKNTKGERYVRSLLRRAKAITGKRHELIHVVWLRPKESPSKVHRMKIPIIDDDKSESIEVPIEDLTTLIADIRKLIEEVVANNQKLRNNFPKSLI